MFSGHYGQKVTTLISYQNRPVKGLMVERYLVVGCQKPGEGVYGKSIADPCLGWEKTKELIYRLAEY